MSKIRLTTFKKYVEFARELVQLMHKRYGTRLADVWVHRYARDCVGDDKNVLVHELLMCSEYESEAWKALELIVLYHHRHEIPLSPALQRWTALAAAEVRQVSRKRGTGAHTNFVRDMAIVVVVFLLTKVEGVKATRSVNGFTKCGYTGGSACDVVGKALEELDSVRPQKGRKKGPQKGRKNGLQYSTIEWIWSGSASPDSPLYRYGPSRRPLIEHPRFLIFEPQEDDDRIRPYEDFSALSTPFRILGDLVSAMENDEVQT